MRVYRILSIDGGGIRGLIPALALADLERRSGRPIAQLFDLIAGTGSGALLALALALPGPTGTPLFSAGELAEFLEAQRSRIFHHDVLEEIRRLGGPGDPGYGDSGFEQVLKELFGSLRLGQAHPDLLIPAYDLEKRTPFFFRSRRARLQERYDFPAWVAARAACAAPTYFEPVKVAWPDYYDQDVLVDGGVFANNPGLCAYAEFLALRRSRELPAARPFLVSFGTGRSARALPFDEAREWGPAAWTRHLLDLVLDGAAEAVDFQLDALLPPAQDGTPRYARFQPGLDQDLDDLDNIAPANVEGLHRTARRLLLAQDAELAALAERLRALADA